MKPDAIQKRALKTWYQPTHPLYGDLLHPILALAGEAGELANLLKKDRFKPNFIADRAQYIDELGDCLYYVAIIAHILGVTVDEVSQMNREKLRDGKNGWPESEEGYE